MKRSIRSTTAFGIISLFSLGFSKNARAQSSEAKVQPAPAEEMVVTGERESKAQQLEHSAEAVNVVETKKAQEQSADLGEVLARTQGVSVRREGGLGSNTRFSLNGLTDDQVRFFLDGVPLEQAGYPSGLASVPVNLIERVEIYRGVVPIRFGADALGGVVNLVSPQAKRSSLGVSYQLGSFGTERTAVNGRLRDEDTGVFVAHTAFLDLAKNDYDVAVKLPDERGKRQWTEVPRFHDGYRAYGATLEAGVMDKPWAKRLSLSGFVSRWDKELQNDRFMQNAYGEATYATAVSGATARYDVRPARDLDLALIANFNHRIIDFRDVSMWRYDWLGHRTKLAVPGEIGSASDSTLWQNAGFGRAVATWEIAPEHTLRAALTPNYTSRFGTERVRSSPEAVDRLSPARSLFTLVTGLEYEIDVLDDRISNVVFVKDYVYHADAKEYPLGSDQLVFHSSSSHTLGGGDTLRVRVTPWLDLKASYEYATRLPRPDEVLGDGSVVQSNPELKPEVSHNANLGGRAEWKRTAAGSFTLDVNAFLRDSKRLIFLNGSAQSARFENVYNARSLGLENAASWTAPRGFAGVDGTFTWLDQRNTSTSGQFASLEGDRLPNRPYLFASWGAHLHFDGFPTGEDSLEPFYYGRYVHGFFLTWESVGAGKLNVPAQVSHDFGVTWLISREVARVTLTLEAQNITNAKLFDNFGIQRPGRAFYAKVTATLP